MIENREHTEDVRACYCYTEPCWCRTWKGRAFLVAMYAMIAVMLCFTAVKFWQSVAPTVSVQEETYER